MPTIETGRGEPVFYESPHALGEPTPGARIVFIHGTGVDHRLFEDQLRFFSAAQTPVSIDLPGHGQSPGEALEDVVEYRPVLKGFIDNARLAPVVLCGHALGAAIALDYTVNHPRDVEGLVLMDFGRTFPGAADSAADSAAGSGGVHEIAKERTIRMRTSLFIGRSSRRVHRISTRGNRVSRRRFASRVGATRREIRCVFSG